MQDSRESRTSWIVVGLILVGVVSRLVPHPWNATPVTAIALFGGTYLSKRWAILLPLAIVAMSDLVLGWHSTILFTWGAFAVTGWLAWWIRVRPSAARILAGSLLGSVIFFLVTNFGVWAMQTLYPRTLAGLWECYVAGLPFFRNALAGDLIYTGVLFGMYATIAVFGFTPARVKPE
jgi:hypothetical protein